MSQPLLRFDNKVAVVTGAGGAIGGAYATMLAARGAKVVVNDINADTLEQTVAAIRDAGGTAEAAVFDISSSDNCEQVLNVARSQWGNVDILINNAGIVGSTLELEDISDQEYDDIVRVSQYAAAYLCRGVWKAMKEQQYGRIINTASNSIFGMGSAIPYPAAKSSMIGMSKSLAAAGKHFNIKVNTILPSAASSMTLVSVLPEGLKKKLREEFQPEKIAACVLPLLHEDAPASGEIFSVGGGRIGRIFLGQSPGLKDKDITPEKVLQGFDQVMDISHYEVMNSTVEDLALHGIGLEHLR